MEHVLNEEKAIELAENISPYDIGGDNTAHYAAKDAALDAMDWKDEQFQKVLDYAEICYGVFSFKQRESFINHIKEIFYGKE